MKRASYREAVAVAAEFDNDITEPEEVAGLLTVHVIAAIFDVSQHRVAADILKRRDKVQP